MNSLFKGAVVSGLLCAATAAYAVWGNAVHILGYYTYANGPAYIRTDGNQNPENCTSGGYLLLDNTAANFKALYATAMTAQATNQIVTLGYDGCKNGYPVIISIAVGGIW